MGDGTDIIIKGGSIDLSFADSVYPKDPLDPRRHKNDDRKITRVLVEDEGGRAVYDSGTDKDGLKWTITVSTTS